MNLRFHNPWWLPTPRMARKCFALPGLFALAFAGPASADAYLGAIGGSGGGQFQARCAGTELLVGFELRSGDDVDAIRPLCVTAYGPRQVSATPFTVGPGFRLTYADANREVMGDHRVLLGDWAELDRGWHGGISGGLNHIVCPVEQPIVTGMFVGAEGVDTVIVNNIHLFCGVAAETQVTSDYPAAIFDAPAYRASRAVFGIGSGGSQPYRDGNTQRCPAGQVGVGVHGRSGRWLDAIGLICGPPRLSEPVKSIARVGSGAPAKPRPPGWTICDAARDARARNSPAAANLEAQCATFMAQVKTPAKAIARVNTGTATVPGPRRHICDSARDARARNSPVAPNLEAQCRAAGGPPAAAPPAAPEPAPAPDPDPVPDPAAADGA